MLLLLIAEALLKIDVLKSCKKVVNQPVRPNKRSSNQGIRPTSRAVAVANKHDFYHRRKLLENTDFILDCGHNDISRTLNKHA